MRIADTDDQKVNMKKVKLFCFPYAGGSSTVYNSWDDPLGANIRVCPVELAGRGRRINEPHYGSLAEAAADVVRRIKHQLFDAPFAFYGHSLGGAIAYETTQLLRDKRYPQPMHIFFSGRGVPHILREDIEPYHKLPHDEFKEKVMELGGTPKEFFEHPELLEILLPLLRSDFHISRMFTEEFGSIDQIKPLDVDITVLTGEEEDLKPEQIGEWTHHTNRECTFHSFEGGHFFINDPQSQERIFSIIGETLRNGSMQRATAYA
ncbi:MAG: thioesterase [bacterium]|nr:thioesterase [bacterium]